jgi:hypothetical protein
MITIRTLFAALALAAVGIAQASEISEPPQAMSMKTRADVTAEARRAPQTNQLYDGREHMTGPAAMPRMRDDVRAEARANASAPRAASLYVGG